MVLRRLFGNLDLQTRPLEVRAEPQPSPCYPPDEVIIEWALTIRNRIGSRQKYQRNVGDLREAIIREGLVLYRHLNEHVFLPTPSDAHTPPLTPFEAPDESELQFLFIPNCSGPHWSYLLRPLNEHEIRQPPFVYAYNTLFQYERIGAFLPSTPALARTFESRYTKASQLSNYVVFADPTVTFHNAPHADDDIVYRSDSSDDALRYAEDWTEEMGIGSCVGKVLRMYDLH